MSVRESFSSSPFSVSWIDASNEEETVKMLNKMSGEIVEIPKSKRVSDRMAYAKVSMKFCSDLCESDALGISGLRVLFVVLRVLQRSKDQVFLNYATFESMAKGGWKMHTYYKGLNELLDANIIAKVKNAHDMYWVNTDYIFKGDRVKMINNKRFANGIGN